MRPFYSTCFLMWDALAEKKSCLTVLLTAQILSGSAVGLKMLGLPVKVCSRTLILKQDCVYSLLERFMQSFSKP